MITLTDNKGFYWELEHRMQYTVSETGFIEMWLMVIVGFPKALENYPSIPVPVFTDWWPT